MATYQVACFFQREDVDTIIVDTGLTLEEAQEICHDPETSSNTCTSPSGKERTKKFGTWFYGYKEE